ncbi:MAG: hypothetical protein PVG14_03035 [Anaerolineales bacterium]|jgi:hypothetical protein
MIVQEKRGSDHTEQRERYRAAVAPHAVEIGEERLLFPGGVLLPLSLRGKGVPGMPERPWSRLAARDFYAKTPLVYSVSLRREPPDILRGTLRARRTLFEGLMLAMAEKTGRRPSMAEQAADHAMDAAESAVTLGEPAFRATLLTALYARRRREAEVETARRTLEATLRARGFVPQRLYYIPERALLHFQPGGKLFPGLDEPVLLLDEALSLLPSPARQVLPCPDAVLIGTHASQGRDVYFSFTRGFDPSVPPPPHSLTLILGEPGSGKTSLMRLILLQRLLQGCTVVTLDPEGENNRLCEAVGGRVIPAGVPQDTGTCLIHPLQAQAPAEMLLAARFLIAALSGESALSVGAQAALHAAVKRRWERRPGPMSLADLVDALGTINEPGASAPMALLQPYAAGGLWDGFFDRPKALLSPNGMGASTPTSAMWSNFDLSSLREENKAIVHAVLAWFLYHTVTVRKSPMDVFIDEGWRLLRSGTFVDLLDELGRRARKRGVGVSLTTHLPGDLLHRSASLGLQHSTSLSMASTAFIGRMGPEESFTFFRSLGVSESGARRNSERVARLPPRVFLAAPAGGRGSLFPVRVTIPPVWLDFWGQLGAAR